MYHNMLQQEIIFEEFCRADSAAELCLEGAGHGHVAGLQVHQQVGVLGELVATKIAPEICHVLNTARPQVRIVRVAPE